MIVNDKQYNAYVNILRDELISAQGCTEPISIAYCASVAKELLKDYPTSVDIECSANIIKNVKSVVIPSTNGQKGIEIAAAAGIVGGDASKQLEVLANVSDLQKEEISKLRESASFKVIPSKSRVPLDIIITLKNEDEESEVRLAHTHSRIIYKKYNGEYVYKESLEDKFQPKYKDYKLTVKEIVDFANIVDISDIKEIFEKQVAYNYEISEVGLTEDFGANIGQVICSTCETSVRNRAKARAAAGSDARMNGCELPVVINSGSGNQGLTVSLPVIEYAHHLKSSEEDLYRALVISNLCAIHQKSNIGVLSAFCGVISAGAAAGAAIAYLQGGDYDAISTTISNSLAITSGIICDGAKASCAAKIATGVEAGIFGYEMYLNGKNFKDGDGIVAKDIEKTIENIGRIGKYGMQKTDEEILEIMTCFD